MAAVDAITSIFQGQVKRDGLHYLADTGIGQTEGLDLIHDAYRNAPILLSEEAVHQAVKACQIKHGLKPSEELYRSYYNGRPSYHLTIEMETGTGKTYTYIRTIMELHQRYGWLKFIIVVPSVAIREGVKKSFEMMAEHFQMEYGKSPSVFVYDSSRLGDLDTFANSADLKVMIINSQAFNAKGAINMEQEAFRWRKPIDVIASTHPIMIIDEPQSVEGEKTKEHLKKFHPLMTLRYSATHREAYNMVYRLDAMDAYNQKLVKKIAVKAIEQSGTTGTEGYLYLQDIVLQKTGKPKARIEFEVSGANGVRRQTKLVEDPFDLYAESGELPAYKGWTLSHFDARDGENSIQIGPTRKLHIGEVIGERHEDDVRRLQIRETIKSHLEKEEKLFHRGIKVLSLFFIDEVAKYKQYDEQHDAYNGDYADMFEEEYNKQVKQYLKTHMASAYKVYLERHSDASEVHAGYFSIDKVKKSDKVTFVDYKSKSEQKSQVSNDKDAYDLIMKDKERLLSFDEPVRFIFSHSALKEGWDNPNVFQICTLKQSTADTRKRQEIGRGMRLAVDKHGIRQDEELLGASVHDINKLTVIANESYDDFSRQLQNEIKEVLANRPQKVTESLFLNHVLEHTDGHTVTLDQEESQRLYAYLIKNDYVDTNGHLTEHYSQSKAMGNLTLPEELRGFEVAVVELLDMVYDYKIENANDIDVVFSNEINRENMAKKEFQDLWERINQKTSYRVSFDEDELVEESIKAINEKLSVKKPVYHITEGSADKMTETEGLAFTKTSNKSRQEVLERPHITVPYDLLGELTVATGLKRQTIAQILSRIYVYHFNMFKVNPEDFILKVGRLLNEVKAQQVIKHIEYHLSEERYDESIFTTNPLSVKQSDKSLLLSDKGVYNYVKVDSAVEETFKDSLEAFEDVKVYAKLPTAFKIATPVGDYNPDWAIAFREGSVKHIYFVAETKGSLSSLQLKGAEQAKIDCAKAHFKALQESGILSQGAVYDVVSSYEELMELIS